MNCHLLTVLNRNDVYRHHDSKTIHRDVKPRNIVFHQTEHGVDLILTDFDGAIDVSSDQSPCVFPVGTIPYIAPEMMKYGSNVYSVDIWSAAITSSARKPKVPAGFETTPST
jgi:serine/threonine protein kinase